MCKSRSSPDHPLQNLVSGSYNRIFPLNDPFPKTLFRLTGGVVSPRALRTPRLQTTDIRERLQCFSMNKGTHLCIQALWVPRVFANSTLGLSEHNEPLASPYASVPSFCEPLPSKTLLPLLKSKLHSEGADTQGQDEDCKCHTFIK